HMHAVRVVGPRQAGQVKGAAGGGNHLFGILVLAEGKGVFHPEQPQIVLFIEGKAGKHPAMAWAEKFHGVLLVLMQMIIVIIRGVGKACDDQLLCVDYSSSPMTTETTGQRPQTANLEDPLYYLSNADTIVSGVADHHSDLLTDREQNRLAAFANLATGPRA